MSIDTPIFRIDETGNCSIPTDKGLGRFGETAIGKVISVCGRPLRITVVYSKIYPGYSPGDANWVSADGEWVS